MVYTPTATYRLQLSPDFTLEQLRHIIPYLHKLGVSTIYAAPIFAAREGSTHGYDVTDPTSLNKAIGSEKELKEISRLLKEKKMGWLQDIVPNHMAYSQDNKWLMDVLEKGPNSSYVTFFDLWEELADRKEEAQFMTPFLGSPLEECLKNSEIKLSTKEGSCFFNYYDNQYPLSLTTYAFLLSNAPGEKLQKAYLTAEELRSDYQPETAEKLKKQLKEAHSEFSDWCKEIESREKEMKALLDKQYYRLCYWKETENRINYRRFFTVNDLICLNIQHPEVFKTYHSYIKELVNGGQFQGLRIDHIDGLYNPGEYLNELRKLIGEDTYLVVEKILEKDEVLSQQWPIEGTTGYDFLSMLNALFVFTASGDDFTRLYQEFSEDQEGWNDLVWNNKKLILHKRMQGEFENLLKLYYKYELNAAAEKPEHTAEALSHFLLSFPVYRTYINSFPISDTDLDILNHSFGKAESRISKEALPALHQLQQVYYPQASGIKEQERLHFIQRLQQVSGPLEAKGLEDTTFYAYNRLVSLNEVGGQPQHFGLDLVDFHAKMKSRQERIPLTLNCSATHDTKRGEDARQRINALSEIPDRWIKKVGGWRELNEGKKESINGVQAPDGVDEYFIYQSLLAFYPSEGEHKSSFVERLHQYMEKAMREGKRHSSWSAPNQEYESATKRFIDKLLADEAFMYTFQPLARELNQIGALKSAGQVLIKMMAPGIPDVYQGTELPDFSMVDPDNRRPVNYTQHQEFLDELITTEPKGPDQLHQNLYDHLTDGRFKLFITHKCLIFRRQYPSLCTEGKYLPIACEGLHKNKVIAFVRLHEKTACLLIVPLFPAQISTEAAFLPAEKDWADTRLLLPAEVPAKWVNVFTGQEHQKSADGQLPLATLLNKLPLALLKGGEF